MPKAKETSPSPPVPAPIFIEASYSQEEAAIIGHMRNLMGNDPYHFLVNEEEKAIVNVLKSLVGEIRKKTKTAADFFAFQDKHFEEPEYQFLLPKHPGLNVTGWRVFMVYMDPLVYGKGIDRSEEDDVPGTISHRSAKFKGV